MDYESQKIAYDMFLLNEVYEQRKMDLFIQEAILWTSGQMDSEKLQTLQEGVKDTVKEKLKSAWEKVKEIVRKIVNRISNFARSEKSFYERNKNIILGKKVTYQDDFSLYPYTEGIKRMGQIKIAPFEFEKIQKIPPDDFNEMFKSYFKITAFETSKDDLLDKAKDYFRGGNEKTYTAAQLNMTDMYNVCVDYKEKIESTYKSDLDVINSTQEKMLSAISKIKINENVSIYGDPSNIYSSFFESYVFVNETNTNNNNNNNNNNNSSDSPEKETDNISSKTNNTQVNKAGDQIKNNKINKGDSTVDRDQIEKDVNGDKEKIENFEKRCELYIDIARTVTQAKMAIAEEMYKKYREIINKHVKSYGGQAKDDVEGNKPKSAASDFNNDLTDDAKKALQNQKNITDVKIAYTSDNTDNSNGDKYIIRITTKDSEGNTNSIDQDVSSIYSASTDSNLEFKAGSIEVKQDKNGIWGLYRIYKDNSNGGKEKKMVIYINPTRAGLSNSDFSDANTDVKKTNTKTS